jgi:ornithine carbamoyltransferase
MQKVRHLVTLKDYDGSWIRTNTALAIRIKEDMKPGGIIMGGASSYRNKLEGKRLVSLFEKPSLRTRVSFAFGMPLLGGFSETIDTKGMHFATSDPVAEIKSLSSLCDIIMIRPLKHSTVALFAQHSTVPVINGLSESDHPCQALADVMTIHEVKGTLEGVKVVYLGIANNVSNSLSLACVESGAYFVLCTPPGENGRDPDARDPALMARLKASGRYTEEPDVAKAVKGAHILYTDTWVNMEHLGNAELLAARKALLMPYQLNKNVMELAGPKAFSMHDLPAHTGLEIDEFALHGPRSIAFRQAENRMWAQMAVMMQLLGEQ